MFHFTKPDGSNFDLDYLGPIHAFDSDNRLIATCDAPVPVALIEPDFMGEDEVGGLPENWDNWHIVIEISESDQPYLQRALASAWCAISLCERMVR